MWRIAAIVSILTVGVGCTAGNHPPARRSSSDATSSSATASVAATASPATEATAVNGGVALTGTPCVTPLPTASAALVQAGTLWRDQTLRFVPGVPVLGTGGLLAEVNSAGRASFTVVGHNAQTIATVGSVTGPAGIGSDFYGAGYEVSDSNHVAFVFQSGPGNYSQNTWTIYLWTRSTGRLVAVAHNSNDASGTALAGGYVPLFLSGPYLYWIQASAVTGVSSVGSELMQYDVLTGMTKVIFDGLVTAATAYKSEVLFAATDNPTPLPATGRPPVPDIHAADQATGQAESSPPGLTLGDDEPIQMVSNEDLVVWDSNAGGLRGWRPETGKTFTILPNVAEAPAALRQLANPNDLAIDGKFLAWDEGTSYLLDLKTNSVAQLTVNRGEASAAGDQLSFWQYTNDVRPTNGIYTYSAYVLDLSTLPDLLGC